MCVGFGFVFVSFVMAANISMNTGGNLGCADSYSGIAEALTFAGRDGHANLWVINTMCAHYLKELGFMNGILIDVFISITVFFVNKWTNTWYGDCKVCFREFLLS